MKVQATMVLFAILLGLCLPASSPVLVVCCGEQAIGVPDVCHSAAPATSCGSDMLFLNEDVHFPAPAAVVALYPVNTTIFPQALFSIRNERPPIV